MMRIFTFLLFSLCPFLVLQAEITHVEFPEGLEIGLDQNYALDIDNNDVVDFYVNAYEGELGFVPTYFQGCLSSPSQSAVTAWGSRKLQVHEEGEEIIFTQENFFDYIDEDRGSSYSSTEGFDDGWEDLKSVYIGFVIFSGNGQLVSNGWAKVHVDLESESLVIEEYAYTDFQEIGFQGIKAGDTGLINSVNTLGSTLSNVSFTPNPANEESIVQFHYNGSDAMTLGVFSSNGQLIYSQNMGVLRENQRITLNTAEWGSGMYYVRFKTSKGIRVEQLAILR